MSQLIDADKHLERVIPLTLNFWSVNRVRNSNMFPISDKVLGTFPRRLRPKHAPKAAFMLHPGDYWVTTGYAWPPVVRTSASLASSTLLLCYYY